MGMIAGLHASVIEHQPPAPLPEFKTSDQLAKWRAETTARTAIQESTSSRLSTLESSTTPFYTGKPYLAESGSYAFKYREYNPEMGRWTTVDPSGFPDGANNRVFVAAPTSGLDNNGLNTVYSYDLSVNKYYLTIDTTTLFNGVYSVTSGALTAEEIVGFYQMTSGASDIISSGSLQIISYIIVVIPDPGGNYQLIDTETGINPQSFFNFQSKAPDKQLITYTSQSTTKYTWYE